MSLPEGYYIQYSLNSISESDVGMLIDINGDFAMFCVNDYWSADELFSFRVNVELCNSNREVIDSTILTVNLVTNNVNKTQLFFLGDYYNLYYHIDEDGTEINNVDGYEGFIICVSEKPLCRYAGVLYSSDMGNNICDVYAFDGENILAKNESQTIGGFLVKLDSIIAFPIDAEKMNYQFYNVVNYGSAYSSQTPKASADADNVALAGTNNACGIIGAKVILDELRSAGTRMNYRDATGANDYFAVRISFSNIVLDYYNITLSSHFCIIFNDNYYSDLPSTINFRASVQGSAMTNPLFFSDYLTSLSNNFLWMLIRNINKSGTVYYLAFEDGYSPTAGSSATISNPVLNTINIMSDYSWEI